MMGPSCKSCSPKYRSDPRTSLAEERGLGKLKFRSSSSFLHILQGEIQREDPVRNSSCQGSSRCSLRRVLRALGELPT